jgi:uncharacterized protein YggT (Ycf19 family)
MATVTPKKPAKPSDGKLHFIKAARVLTYIGYGYALVASAFLGFGFFLLLFGASTDAAFTEFIYKVAAEFLQPFRGIFPSHPVGETGYFNASAIFAIMVYLFLAMLLHALLTYVTTVQVRHQRELEDLLRAQQTAPSVVLVAKPVQQTRRAPNSRG